jgi:hypothetical protein
VENSKPPAPVVWIGIVLLGACARLIPHPWNFTPLVAIGLFAGTYARSAGAAAAMTLLSLILSDLALGFYQGFWVVYAAALVPVLAGRLAAHPRSGLVVMRSGLVEKSPAIAAIAGAGLVSSLSFFLITNFGVWAGGALYPRTLAGLAACYAAGIPFYRNQLAGDVFYVLLMFGGYAAIARLWTTRASAQASA